MATIAQIVQQIRSAVYGRDVRENIAEGIEKCYSDIEEGTTWISEHATQVIEDADNAAESASIAQAASTTAVSTANAIEQKINNMTATASPLAAGSRPTASVTEENGHKVINFGIPNGTSASIVQEDVYYQNADASTAGVVIPTGEWLTEQPTTDPGDYLWIKRVLTWNTGEETTMYTMSRMGINGEGTYSIQLGENGSTYQPDANQKIVLPVDNAPEQNSNSLITSGGVSSAIDAEDDKVDTITGGLAVIESGDVATQHITTGEYVIWNNVTFRAKSNIEIGDELSTSVLVRPDKGAFNDIGGKVVSTLAELVDVTSRTPNIPVLLSLPSQSEAEMALASGEIPGTRTGHCECIARYVSSTAINCLLILAARICFTRYNQSTGDIEIHRYWLPSNDLCKIVNYSKNYTIENNKTRNWTSADFGLSTPNGYRYAAVVGFTSGSAHVSVSYVNPTGANVFGVRNNSGTTRGTAQDPLTARVNLLYIKSDAFV